MIAFWAKIKSLPFYLLFIVLPVLYIQWGFYFLAHSLYPASCQCHHLGGPLPIICHEWNNDNLKIVFLWVNCDRCYYWLIPCEKSEKKTIIFFFGYLAWKVKSVIYFSNKNIFFYLYFLVIFDHFIEFCRKSQFVIFAKVRF